MSACGCQSSFLPGVASRLRERGANSRLGNASLSTTALFPPVGTIATSPGLCSRSTASLLALRESKRKRSCTLERRTASSLDWPLLPRARGYSNVPLHLAGTRPWSYPPALPLLLVSTARRSKLIPRCRDDCARQVDISETRVLAVLRRLFPSVCAVGAKAYGLTAEESFEAEALAIEAAVASRKIEFSAGRRAARRALEGAGFPGAVIPIGPDRSPIWPAGAVGSISHAAGVAVAVAAPAALVSGLGVAVERSATLTEELFGQVMTPGEFDLLRRLPESDQCRYATAVFSIKEAFFKLQF